MEGMGTDEGQLIRIICCASFKERSLIISTYEQMYDKSLIAQVESETSGHFQIALVAILESSLKNWDPDYNEDVRQLKEAMDGVGTDEDAVIRVIANKDDEQLEILCNTFKEQTGVDLIERVDSETFDWGAGMFLAANFRKTMLTLLRPKKERLARCMRYCMQGWGTDDTGLITCLVHLSEMERKDLIQTYRRIFNRDPFDDIRSETSGDYEDALIACLEPQVHTYVRAIRKAMAGLGTSDNLLINWMVMCKDRMDEIREQWKEVYEGEDLASWIKGDCSGDYQDTLVRIANRECVKFAGVEVACTVPAPASQEDSILRFNKTFNKLCADKKANPGVHLELSEAAQQELGCAFLFWGAKSSCAPNLDIQGLWDLTNALGGEVGFAPQNDHEDLRATFQEWNVSGTGQIDWNDFVTEMTTRVNDPNHFNAQPLREKRKDMDEKWVF